MPHSFLHAKQQHNSSPSNTMKTIEVLDLTPYEDSILLQKNGLHAILDSLESYVDCIEGVEEQHLYESRQGMKNRSLSEGKTEKQQEKEVVEEERTEETNQTNEAAAPESTAREEAATEPTPATDETTSPPDLVTPLHDVLPLFCMGTMAAVSAACTEWAQTCLPFDSTDVTKNVKKQWKIESEHLESQPSIVDDLWEHSLCDPTEIPDEIVAQGSLLDLEDDYESPQATAVPVVTKSASQEIEDLLGDGCYPPNDTVDID